MSPIQKLDADIRRIFKHARNDGVDIQRADGDSLRVYERIALAFEEAFPESPALAREIGAYWLRKYRGTEHIDWLLDALAFLAGEEDTGAIPLDDWKDIRDILSDEADDLPLALLTRLMGAIVEKKAL